MSHHELNLDVGKASGAVCWASGAVRRANLHMMAIFPLFDCVHGFSLMEDVLPF